MSYPYQGNPGYGAPPGGYGPPQPGYPQQGAPQPGFPQQGGYGQVCKLCRRKLSCECMYMYCFLCFQDIL